MSDYDRIANLEEENAKLRSLVKELSDALNDANALVCKGEYCNRPSLCPDCQATKNRALVAKARDAVS